MRFYSMPFDEVLDLRLKTFFALNREAMKLQAKDYREQLAIAISPRQNEKWYEMLYSQYTSIIDQTVKKLPPKPPRPALDGVDGHNAVIALFSRRHARGRR